MVNGQYGIYTNGQFLTLDLAAGQALVNSYEPYSRNYAPPNSSSPLSPRSLPRLNVTDSSDTPTEVFTELPPMPTLDTSTADRIIKRKIDWPTNPSLDDEAEKFRNTAVCYMYLLNLPYNLPRMFVFLSVTKERKLARCKCLCSTIKKCCTINKYICIGYTITIKIIRSKNFYFKTK